VNVCEIRRKLDGLGGSGFGIVLCQILFSEVLKVLQEWI